MTPVPCDAPPAVVATGQSSFFAERRPQRVALLAILVVLLALLFGNVVKYLVLQWLEDANSGHGFLVPLLSAWLVYMKRSSLRNVPRQGSRFGLAFMIGGLAMLAVGTLGVELFLGRVSLLVFLTGAIQYAAGWRTLRLLAFPLGYLFFMIPLPTLVMNQVAFPLQLLASSIAARSLELSGIPVMREGNLIFVPHYSMEVVEACSGIRSLTALLAMALGYGYLVEKHWLSRLALVTLVFPVAVAANGLRVFGTGVLGYMGGAPLADGFSHTFSGLLVFATAVVLLLLAHRAISLLLERRNWGAHG